MIEELITRIVDSVGIDRATAEKAVGTIISFLEREAPREHVDAMMEAMPGAQDLANKEAGKGSFIGSMVSGMGSVMGGGGVMALGTQLMGQGLSMGQIQGVSKQIFAFAKEKAGEDTVGAVVGAIPGLSQFV